MQKCGYFLGFSMAPVIGQLLLGPSASTSLWLCLMFGAYFHATLLVCAVRKEDAQLSLYCNAPRYKMALPLPPGLTPSEVGFLCEMDMVTVIPRQRLEGLELLGVSAP